MFERNNNEASINAKPIAPPEGLGKLNAAGAGCRMSARTALFDAAHRLNERAMQLSELARSIPENFPLTADAALYQLVMDSIR